MKLVLSTHNLTLTKAIEDHLISRLEKLDHFDRRAVDARVTLELDHKRAPEKQFICSIKAGRTAVVVRLWGFDSAAETFRI